MATQSHHMAIWTLPSTLKSENFLSHAKLWSLIGDRFTVESVYNETRNANIAKEHHMSKIDLNTLFSAKDHAVAYVAATSSQRKEIAKQIEAKASVSKRVRWQNLLKAVKAGDMARVEAYGLSGNEKASAFKAIRAGEQPKAAAKPAAKPTARKPARKPAPQPSVAADDMNALARKIADMVPESQRAAFFTLVMDAKK